MGIVEGGREAKTFFKKLVPSLDEKSELVGAKLFTGRTHQIRVHLGSLHRHILGDGLYGFKGSSDKIPRVFLHAYMLYLIHPKDGRRLNFIAQLPDDIKDYLQRHFDMERVYDAIDPDTFASRFDAL